MPRYRILSTIQLPLVRSDERAGGRDCSEYDGRRGGSGHRLKVCPELSRTIFIISHVLLQVLAKVEEEDGA